MDKERQLTLSWHEKGEEAAELLGTGQEMPRSTLEKLNSVSFDTLLKQQDPFGRNNGFINLREVKWISPAALTQLSAACFALTERKISTDILITDLSVRSYLVRSGFVDIVTRVAEIWPPFSVPELDQYRLSKGSNQALIEVTKIESNCEISEVLDKFIDVLITCLQYPKKEALAIAVVLSEILQNTFDHNDNSCVFVATQVYGQPGKMFLEIGISDYGYGLATTLSRNPKNLPISSDTEAIRKAIKLGTSEYDDPTRGTGLHHLYEVAYQNRGSVQIRSGKAAIRFRMDKSQGWEFVGAFMPGVQIALKLPFKGKYFSLTKPCTDDTL